MEMTMQKHNSPRSKAKVLAQSQVEIIACLCGLAATGAGWYALKLLLQI
jgi:hypothetical protein